MTEANVTAIGEDRSRAYSEREGPRYWWHRMPGADYVPPVYNLLTADEWQVMDEWFADTDLRYSPHTGECGVPLMSLMQGLVMGSAIRRIVQCGHFVGYSALLFGFMLRKMGHARGLYSVDIDEAVTTYARGWIDRARLSDYVHLAVGDSADPLAPDRARSYLGGDIQLVFVDSAHQYAHTVRELDLWYDALADGGFIVLHDVSQFATTFDSTGEGGVARGVSEWAAKRGTSVLTVNGFVGSEAGPPGYVPYADGCGVGIIQRPGPR